MNSHHAKFQLDSSKRIPSRTKDLMRVLLWTIDEKVEFAEKRLIIVSPNLYYFNKTVGVNDASSIHYLSLDLATFSFLIFFTTFSYFHSSRQSFLLVTLCSSSLLPPLCCSFLLVPLSSSSSTSFRFRKRTFFIDFDVSVTEEPTERRTDQTTNQWTRPLVEMRGRIYKSCSFFFFWLKDHYLNEVSITSDMT